MGGLRDYSLTKNIRLYELLATMEWWLAKRGGEYCILVRARRAPPFFDFEEWAECVEADLAAIGSSPGLLPLVDRGRDSEFPFEEKDVMVDFPGWAPYAAWGLASGPAADLGAVCQASGGKLPVDCAVSIIAQVGRAFAQENTVPAVQTRTIVLDAEGGVRALPALVRVERCERQSRYGSEWVNEIGLLPPERLMEFMTKCAMDWADPKLRLVWNLPRGSSCDALQAPFVLATALLDLVTDIGSKRPLRDPTVMGKALQAQRMPRPSSFHLGLEILNGIFNGATRFNPSERLTLEEFLAELEGIGSKLAGGQNWLHAPIARLMKEVVPRISLKSLLGSSR